MVFPSEDPTEPRVVYEDECLVAVDKPPRMHSAPGLGGGGLSVWVFDRYPEIEAIGRAGEGGLLHRLDFETSGLVLFARTEAAFVSLLEQQSRGAFVKEYRAWSTPSLASEPRGSRPATACPAGPRAESWSEAREALNGPRLAELIRGPDARGTAGYGAPCAVVSAFRSYGPKGSRVACLGTQEGAQAQNYRSDLLSCSCDPGSDPGDGSATLELRLSLVRGFRHQLRAHLAWIGLPIRGDALYGGRPDARLRLYAERLDFAHPGSGRVMSLGLGET